VLQKFIVFILIYVLHMFFNHGHSQVISCSKCLVDLWCFCSF